MILAANEIRNRQMMQKILFCAFAALLCTVLFMWFASPAVTFAGESTVKSGQSTDKTDNSAKTTGDTGTATTMIENVVKIVCIIVMIVGGLFCLVGVVKFAIAHAENQGPEQQKATLMLATGIVLIVLPAVLNGLKLGQLVSTAISSNQLG